MTENQRKIPMVDLRDLLGKKAMGFEAYEDDLLRFREIRPLHKMQRDFKSTAIYSSWILSGLFGPIHFMLISSLATTQPYFFRNTAIRGHYLLHRYFLSVRTDWRFPVHRQRLPQSKLFRIFSWLSPRISNGTLSV